MNYNQDSPQKTPEDPKKKLVNYINNPKEDPKRDIAAQLKNLENLCKNNTHIQLKYDGFNICQLSGEIIGQEKFTDLEVAGTKYRIKNKHLLTLIKKHCFWENIFDWSLSTIYNVQLIQEFSINTRITLNIEITDKILQDVYGIDEYQKLRDKITTFYQESNCYYESLEKKVQFECPITKKKFYSLLDGVNIQGRLYSIEGALKIYNENQDKLFDHQKEFLKKYQELRAGQ